MKKHTLITSVEMLKEICIEAETSIECFISFGIARSSKSIFFDEDEGKFSILNEIDDSEQMLSEDELNDECLTNIGKAIKHNAFYLY